MFKRKKYYIKKVTDKTRAKNKIRKEKLDVYYETLMENCFFCAETKKRITPSRMSICHIFPKRTYKSIEADLDNHIYLQPSLHSRLDVLLDTLNLAQIEKEFPNSWGLICERVKRLLPKITEKKRLLITFQDYLQEKFGKLIN